MNAPGFGCRLVLGTVLACVATGTACTGRERPNLVLVTLDTTRADALGCYGRSTARTPNLDALAAQGVLFERCVSVAPITLPSHSSILTGLYPIRHGVRDNGLFSLPEECETVAEILRREGYETGAAIASFPLLRQFGVAQGFSFFDDDITSPFEDARSQRRSRRPTIYFDERPAERVNDAILPWLREHAQRPFFVWVHYFDPHQPLNPPVPYNQEFAADPYHGEIAYVDECFGQLMENLQRLGVAERTVVAVVGDHGEGRGDHNELTHSLLAYDSTLRVPLIVRAPGIEGGRRVESRVGTVDLLPTLLEILEVPVPDHLDGRSLVSTIDGRLGAGDEGRQHFAETLSPRLSSGWGELRVIYDQHLKYIHGPTPELFDLREDPDELHDLVPSMPAEATRMRDALQRWMTTTADASVSGAVLAVDEETVARLAALGYLSAGRDDPSTITELLRDDGVAPQSRIGDVNRISMAKQMLVEKNYLAAKEIVLPMFDADPQNPHYLTVLAEALIGLGSIDEAVETVLRSPISTVPAARVCHLLGVMMFERGDRATGIDLVQRSVGAAQDATFVYTLARMKQEMGALDEYLAGLETCLQIDPSFAPARVALGVLRIQHNDSAAAEECFRTAIRDRPLYAPGHYNLARLLLDRGDLEAAAVHLSRAEELDPAYCQAVYGHMVVALDLGRDETARRSYAGLIERCQGTPYLERADLLMTD